MSAPVLNGPLVLPMFRSLVSWKTQPWIYLFIAVTFQLSGDVYSGASSQIIDSMPLMREDTLIRIYANPAGMATYLPLLSRVKFRSANKTLPTSAALGVLFCNPIVPHITFLPLLRLVCFIEGMCKIQETFEYTSNIQLWMTLKRDFAVFFPWFRTVILGSIQLSDLLMTRLMYHYHWTCMNLFAADLMLIVLLIQLTCVKRLRFTCKFSLFGINWPGGILRAALLAKIVFLSNYGGWYDWWNSPVIRQLTIMTFITLGICIWRVMTIRHLFLKPKMRTHYRFLPLLGLATLVEALLATEHVLEEVFYEEVIKYGRLVSSQLDWLAIVDIACDCVFSYWWMRVKQYNYVRLVIVGFIELIGYLTGFYLTLSTDIHISQLYLPTICRGFAYAILSVIFMMCLEEVVTSQYFFQRLSVSSMLHMVVGGVTGVTVYAQGLAYYVPDNLAYYGSAIDHVAFSSSPFNLGYYMEELISQMMEISIEQIYDWVTYAYIFPFLSLLPYDFPARRSLKSIPSWKEVTREVKNMSWRTTHTPSEKEKQEDCLPVYSLN